jgi:hypothetical protein
MIVHDFDIARPKNGPNETEAELVIYSDAMLAGAIAFEGCEAIARRHTHVVQFLGTV